LATGVLAIAGEKKSEIEGKEQLFCERHYGRFEPRISVEDVDVDKVYAVFKNGVLTVTLPKIAPAQSKVKPHHHQWQIAETRAVRSVSPHFRATRALRGVASAMSSGSSQSWHLVVGVRRNLQSA
jgi:hypothetical protein